MCIPPCTINESVPSVSEAFRPTVSVVGTSARSSVSPLGKEGCTGGCACSADSACCAWCGGCGVTSASKGSWKGSSPVEVFMAIVSADRAQRA